MNILSKLLVLVLAINAANTQQTAFNSRHSTFYKRNKTKVITSIGLLIALGTGVAIYRNKVSSNDQSMNNDQSTNSAQPINSLQNDNTQDSTTEYTNDKMMIALYNEHKEQMQLQACYKPKLKDPVYDQQNNEYNMLAHFTIDISNISITAMFSATYPLTNCKLRLFYNLSRVVDNKDQEFIIQYNEQNDRNPDSNLSIYLDMAFFKNFPSTDNNLLIMYMKAIMNYIAKYDTAAKNNPVSVFVYSVGPKELILNHENQYHYKKELADYIFDDFIKWIDIPNIIPGFVFSMTYLHTAKKH